MAKISTLIDNEGQPIYPRVLTVGVTDANGNAINDLYANKKIYTNSSIKLGTEDVGEYSIGVGSNTSADYAYTFAQGDNVEASADYQHVTGTYNINNKEALQIVGNGGLVVGEEQTFVASSARLPINDIAYVRGTIANYSSSSGGAPSGYIVIDRHFCNSMLSFCRVSFGDHYEFRFVEGDVKSWHAGSESGMHVKILGKEFLPEVTRDKVGEIGPASSSGSQSLKPLSPAQPTVMIDETNYDILVAKFGPITITDTWQNNGDVYKQFDYNHSNAYELYKNGDMWVNGNVYVGSESGTKDDASERLAKLSDIPTEIITEENAAIIKVETRSFTDMYLPGYPTEPNKDECFMKTDRLYLVGELFDEHQTPLAQNALCRLHNVGPSVFLVIYGASFYSGALGVEDNARLSQAVYLFSGNSIVGPSPFGSTSNLLDIDINKASIRQTNSAENGANIGAQSITYVMGDDSVTLGRGTAAQYPNELVIGKYNSIKSNITGTQYLMIAGNGTQNTRRSNAYTLDSNGNAWFAGDLYLGSTNGLDKDEGSKKVATEEYVSTHGGLLPYNLVPVEALEV